MRGCCCSPEALVGERLRDSKRAVTAITDLLSTHKNKQTINKTPLPWPTRSRPPGRTSRRVSTPPPPRCPATPMPMLAAGDGRHPNVWPPSALRPHPSARVSLNHTHTLETHSLRPLNHTAQDHPFTTVIGACRRARVCGLCGRGAPVCVAFRRPRVDPRNISEGGGCVRGARTVVGTRGCGGDCVRHASAACAQLRDAACSVAPAANASPETRVSRPLPPPFHALLNPPSPPSPLFHSTQACGVASW